MEELIENFKNLYSHMKEEKELMKAEHDRMNSELVNF